MVDFYRFKQFENYPKCIHAVSTKLISEPYDFSLALHTGEDVKSIVNNRKKLSSLLGIDNNLHFIVANQTHSEHIEIITKIETKGWKEVAMDLNRLRRLRNACDYEDEVSDLSSTTRFALQMAARLMQSCR